MHDSADGSTTLGGTRRDPTKKEEAIMGIHWTELLIVSVVALLIFGPKRLPEMGSAIGKTYKEFKKSLNEATQSAATESVTPAELTPASQASAATQATDTGTRS